NRSGCSSRRCNGHRLRNGLSDRRRSRPSRLGTASVTLDERSLGAPRTLLTRRHRNLCDGNSACTSQGQTCSTDDCQESETLAGHKRSSYVETVCVTVSWSLTADSVAVEDSRVS